MRPSLNEVGRGKLKSVERDDAIAAIFLLPGSGALRIEERARRAVVPQRALPSIWLLPRRQFTFGAEKSG